MLITQDTPADIGYPLTQYLGPGTGVLEGKVGFPVCTGMSLCHKDNYLIMLFLCSGSASTLSRASLIVLALKAVKHVSMSSLYTLSSANSNTGVLSLAPLPGC